jgi:tetratricopeptide (TPR) repeat protein
MGRSEDAVRFYRQATATYTEIGDLKNEGSARSNVAIVLIQLQRYDEARQEILRAIECKKPYGHAAQPWTTFALLHDLERAVGNAPAAEDARAAAIAAFLAYRRAGGENHDPGARLAAAVGQAVTSGEAAGVVSQLAELGARPDLPEYLSALVPVLQRIVDGSRDPALASTAGLDYDDAVEVGLLLERLG